MKIITNKDNSSSLKLLVSCEFNKKECILELLEKPSSDITLKRLPLLEVSPGDVLFSTNAAAYFLFPPAKSFESAVDNWLDWEALHLQPSVLRCVDVKGSISEPLVSHLNLVNNALKKSTFLIKDNICVADICVWSTLFPLFTDEKLKPHLVNLTKLSEWFATLEKTSQFQAGLKKLNPVGGIVSIQSISSTCWYPSTQPFSASSADSAASKEVTVKESEIEEAKNFWSLKADKKPKPKPSVVPSLPKASEKNILVTSALPYVNNVPHLGNIIGCVLSADVFARYSRLRNWNTLYVCGTDEYGTATETKAIEEKLTPRQICDKYFAIHRDIYEWFNIQFDLFGRTTTPQQTEIVQDLFKDCHKNGYMCTQSMEQLLCEKCDRYLADRFVEGTCPKCGYEDARGDQCDLCGQLINAVELIKPRCKLCSNTPVVRQSQQLFLDLPKIAPKLQAWVDSTCTGWTQNAEMITKSWLKEGLKPRCITRDLKWGIPVPLEGFEQKVFYVWFDAPIGYISITKCYTEQWRQWWIPEPQTQVEHYQFMAKDNVPFHAIMFPATLMAVDKGHTIVNHVCATEYLNYEDGKFSKSRGVGVFGNDAQDTGIPADVFRFYLLYVRPESQDSSFSWLDLATKNNSELLNNLGNFVNRALVFCEKFFESRVPEVVMTDVEWRLLAQITRELRGYNQAFLRTRLREGVVCILNISRLGNQYIQSSVPWQAIKGGDQDKVRAKTCVGVSCNIACLLAVLLKPYMPQTADTMASQINAPNDLFVLTDHVYQTLPSGHKIGKPVPLFAKIETATVDQLKMRFAGRQQTPPKTTAPVVDPAIDSLEKMEVAVQKQVTHPTAELLPFNEGLRILDPQGNPTFKCFICDGLYLNKMFFDIHLQKHKDQSLKYKKAALKKALTAKRPSKTASDNTSSDKVPIVKITKCKQNSRLDQNQRKNTVASVDCHGSSSSISKNPPSGVNSVRIELLNVETYTCTECGKSFSDKYGVIKHYKALHLGKQRQRPEPLFCGICKQSFSKRSRLQRHMKKHSKESEVFLCAECGRKFNTKNELDNHANGHEESSVYCGICKQSFSSVSHLQQHIKKHSKESELILCAECGWTCGTKNDFDNHTNGHEGSSVYCGICKQGFSSECLVQQHIKEHSKEPVFCDICKQSFSSGSHLQQHMKKHSKESELFLCAECGRSFSRKKDLDNHTDGHERARMRKLTREELPYLCAECGMAFCYKRMLQRHARFHERQKRYICVKCGKQCKYMHHLKKHELTHVKKVPKRKTNKFLRKTIFKCPICFKTLSSRIALTSHKYRHSGESPHSCEICHKKFSAAHVLQFHMLRHKFNCDLCEKSFKDEEALKRHTIRHKNSKLNQFWCKKCGKGFPQLSSLEQHNLWHEERKKRICCDDCGKSFSSNQHLRVHRENIHEGIKPFKCSVCSKGFSSKSNLFRHDLVHNSNAQHLTCATCKQTFESRYQLAKHMKNHPDSKDTVQT